MSLSGPYHVLRNDDTGAFPLNHSGGFTNVSPTVQISIFDYWVKFATNRKSVRNKRDAMTKRNLMKRYNEKKQRNAANRKGETTVMNQTEKMQ